MAIRFKCPKCAEKLEVSDDFAGQRYTCPMCGQGLKLPAKASAAPAPPPRREAPPEDIFDLADEPAPSRPPLPRSVSLGADRDAGISDKAHFARAAAKAESAPNMAWKTKGKASKADRPRDRDSSSGWSFFGLRGGAGAVVFIALFGVRACLRFQRLGAPAGQGFNVGAPANPVDFARSAKSIDAELARDIQLPTSGEARDWLDLKKHPTHAPWLMTLEQAQALVKGFYDQGAVKVYVVDPTEENGKHVADEFAIELPKDPVLRKKCFAHLASLEGGVPEQDVGQRFLVHYVEEP